MSLHLECVNKNQQAKELYVKVSHVCGTFITCERIVISVNGVDILSINELSEVFTQRLSPQQQETLRALGFKVENKSVAIHRNTMDDA